MPPGDGVVEFTAGREAMFAYSGWKNFLGDRQDRRQQ